MDIIDIFTECSTSTTTCFHRFSLQYNENISYEMGYGQAMYVFEAERGKHDVAAMNYCGNVWKSDKSSNFLLKKYLKQLIDNYEQYLATKTQNICYYLGIPQISIEGYFNPIIPNEEPIIVDIDLPFDKVFFRRILNMIEIVYYVHGTTIDNEKKIATGWEQVPLSLKGIKQTRAAALQVNGDGFDAIFSSDLIRAKESAEILFETRKNEIKVDQRLRECNYGIYTKKSNLEIVYQEHIDIPFPNGESLLDVEMRMRSFLNELQLNNYKKVALVSHRIPQLALDVIVSKISWKDAIEKDWRLGGNWKLGWHYDVDNLL